MLLIARDEKIRFPLNSTLKDAVIIIVLFYYQDRFFGVNDYDSHRPNKLSGFMSTAPCPLKFLRKDTFNLVKDERGDGGINPLSLY